MGNSLFDQLKKSGLVDEKKAKQAKKDKHNKIKQQKGKKEKQQDESKLLVQKAQSEKVARDRELNEQRKLAAEHKAITAQIKQIIQMNCIEYEEGEIGFNFSDGSSVQRLNITDKIQNQLVRGRLAIVKLENKYLIVPAGVAEKIESRDSSYVILNNLIESNDQDSNDPYAEFQVPDDLMW